MVPCHTHDFDLPVARGDYGSFPVALLHIDGPLRCSDGVVEHQKVSVACGRNDAASVFSQLFFNTLPVWRENVVDERHVTFGDTLAHHLVFEIDAPAYVGKEKGL